MDLLSARRQYHQWNTIIKSFTMFQSKLSTNHNNIQQSFDFQTKCSIIIQAEHTIYSSLCSPPLTHNPYTMRNLPFLLNTPPFLPRLCIFWINMTLSPHSKIWFASFNEKFYKQDAKFYKEHKELVNLTTMSLHLAEDIKALKEETFFSIKTRWTREETHLVYRIIWWTPW